jgi:hypothetical protein
MKKKTTKMRRKTIDQRRKRNGAPVPRNSFLTMLKWRRVLLTFALQFQFVFLHSDDDEDEEDIVGDDADLGINASERAEAEKAMREQRKHAEAQMKRRQVFP